MINFKKISLFILFIGTTQTHINFAETNEAVNVQKEMGVHAQLKPINDSSAETAKQQDSAWQTAKNITKKTRDQVFRTRTLDMIWKLYLSGQVYAQAHPTFLLNFFKKFSCENNSQRSIINPMLVKAGLDPSKITIFTNSMAAGMSFGQTGIAYNPIIQNDLFTATMAHEIMHLKYCDVLRHALMMLAGSFIVPYLLKQYDLLAQKTLTKIKKKIAPDQESRMYKTLTLVEKAHHAIATSWFTSIFIQATISIKHSCFFEKRAEIQAALLYPEHNVAQTTIKYLKNSQETLGRDRLDIFHPSYSELIAHLEEIAKQQTAA